MTFHTRTLARLGAAGLLATGVIAAVATPAAAAPGDADLEAKISRTTLSATVPGEVATLSLVNHGPNDAAGVSVLVDISKLNGKVTVALAGSSDAPARPCAPRPDRKTLVCDLGKVVIANGAKLDVDFVLATASGWVPNGESISFEVQHQGTDPKADNNRQTAGVKVVNGAPDLFVNAWDVPVNNKLEVGTLAPGETGPLAVLIANRGVWPVTHITVAVQLPAGASFDADLAKKRPDAFFACDFKQRTAKCDLQATVLMPVKDDASATDKIYSSLALQLPVKVDAKAKAGVKLTGGVVSVGALGLSGVATPARDLAPGLADVPPSKAPKGGKSARDDSKGLVSDGFTVFVKAAAPGPGGSAGGDKDKDKDKENGPVLPVTGVQAGAIGGGGLAALVLGGVMFLAARRRRVVLVTPGDEKFPTA